MNVKQEHLIFGLIGVGAVIVLYVLYQESQTSTAEAGAVEAAIPGGSSMPSYPQANPIQLGNVTINETPGYMTASRSGKQFNPVKVTGKGAGELDHCGCEDNNCDAAGVPVTEQKIEQSVLDAAESNLNSFIRKNGSAGWA